MLFRSGVMEQFIRVFPPGERDHFELKIHREKNGGVLQDRVDARAVGVGREKDRVGVSAEEIGRASCRERV